jgi:hypothetical protein
MAFYGRIQFRTKVELLMKTQVIPDTIKKTKFKFKLNWTDAFITKRIFHYDDTPNITADDVVIFVKKLESNEKACGSLIKLKIEPELIIANILSRLDRFKNLRVLQTSSTEKSLHAKFLDLIPSLTELRTKQVNFECDDTYCFPNIKFLELFGHRHNNHLTTFSAVFPNLQRFCLNFLSRFESSFHIVDIGDFEFLQDLTIKEDNPHGKNKITIKLGVLNSLEKLSCSNSSIEFDEKIFYSYLQKFAICGKIPSLINLKALPTLEIVYGISGNRKTIPDLCYLKGYNLTIEFINAVVDLDILTSLDVRTLSFFNTEIVGGSLCSIPSLTSLITKATFFIGIYSQIVEYVQKFPLKFISVEILSAAVMIEINFCATLAKISNVKIIGDFYEGFLKNFCDEHRKLRLEKRPACTKIIFDREHLTEDFVIYAREAGIEY